MKKSTLIAVVLLVASAMGFVISCTKTGGTQSASSTSTKSATSTSTTSTSSPEVIRWSFWGGEARIKNTQVVIDKFTGETGIIVSPEPAASPTDHFAKFKTQAVGGGAADIIQLGGDFANLQVADIGTVLLPLDDLVKKGIIDTSKVDASAIAGGTEAGHLYALPLAANMPCIVYNKDLLERVGAPLPNVSMTWAEFQAWLIAVKAKLPSGVYPFADNSANASQSFFFGYWARDNGTPQWDGTKSYLTAADVKKYFDMWVDLRNGGLIPPAGTAADYDESNEASSSLIAGKVAACVLWSNQLLNYQKATEDNLDLIELPNAAEKNALWGQMSQMMAINKNSKNPEAAAKFINYRVNNPEVWKIMASDPGTPVTPDCRAALPKDPVTDKITAYLNVAGQHATNRDPNLPGDSQWGQEFFNIAQEVAYGKSTSEQAGQKVVQLITRLTRP